VYVFIPKIVGGAQTPVDCFELSQLQQFHGDAFLRPAFIR